MKNKKVMPIEGLPGYLKSVKNNGIDQDNIPVVDMGQIIDDRPNWFKRVAYATSICLFIGLATLAYNKSFTIVVQSDSDPNMLSEIVSEGGGKAYSVIQKEDNTYEIKFFTLKNINSFIKRLRENKELKKVELEN